MKLRKLLYVHSKAFTSKLRLHLENFDKEFLFVLGKLFKNNYFHKVQ
jgi:hypothetical protein